MTSTIPRLHTKSFDVPDQAFPVGDLARVEIVQLGETAVHRATFQPGFRWTEHVKPLMGTDLCEIPHTGYVLSGRLGVRMADGTEREMAPGDAFVIPAVGHDIWVVGDDPSTLLDFPPEEAAHAHG
ncbi:MAG TPA: cupin domain-containing protein [Chloroflexota bacterium]|nr:cupin domain-containing protein [Chloroflexota bacterium]